MRDEPTAEMAVCEAKNPTIREQLVARLASLDRQEAEVRAALTILDKNPAFEEIHDALSRLNVRGMLR